ncbi:hypothetical protein VTH06DRAFT_4803 [Thermothelomyces fergusii]
MAPPFFAVPALPRALLVGGDRPSNPTSPLQSRYERRSLSEHNRSKKIVIFVLAGVITVIFISLALRHLYIRHVRERHKYHKAGHDDDERHQHHEAPSTGRINLEYALSDSSHAQPDTNNNRNNDDSNPAAAAVVDRSGSVRSVMTLPVYRPKPSENELVLGREGERDGIDVVLEMQTVEEEEALRDEQMEALYRIRAARRRQQEEREARRQARRRAQEAGDHEALRQLREEARAAAERVNSEIEVLREEHERISAAARQRAVSSVSYADVGIARADGTRVRANSTESTERVGLLSDAASIAADSLFRRRHGSASTALSIDTSPTAAHARPESPGPSTGGHSWATVAPGPSRAAAEVLIAPATDAADMGMMPPPPGYEEVSLGEPTPLRSPHNSDVSRPVSPYPDPPPEYPGQGPAERRMNRLSAHMEELAAQQNQAQAQAQAQTRTADADADAAIGATTRPSQVPQIVIDSSSARP